MAKIFSIIMAIFTALNMFVSCGKAPGTGDKETTAAPETSVTEPVSEGNPAQTPSNTQPQDPGEEESTTEETQMIKTLTLRISGREMPVTWENNDSVAALSELSSDGLTVNMSMYGGFEQVGSLGSSIPRNDKQTSASFGDIVLYQGNQIVIFYGSNSWSYTRLGHINLSRSEMTDLLSDGDVTINLKYE